MRLLLVSMVAMLACGAPVVRDGGRIAFMDGGTQDATLPSLQAFVRAEQYLSWTAEKQAHASAGPHSTVRTYVNDELYGSLRRGDSTHPAGSIAVKELYTDSKRTGWALMAKRDDQRWIFFEGFEPSLNQYFFEGTSNLCGNCHSAGVDFVRVTASDFR